METCANCGSGIGNLETAFVHQEHVVCAPCYRKLNDAPASPSALPLPQSVRSFGSVSIDGTHLLTGWGIFPLANVSSAMAADVKGVSNGVGIFLIVIGAFVELGGIANVVDPAAEHRLGGVVAMVIGAVLAFVGIAIVRDKGTATVVVSMNGGQQTTIQFNDARARGAFLDALRSAIAANRGGTTYQDNRQVHIHGGPPQLRP